MLLVWFIFYNLLVLGCLWLGAHFLLRGRDLRSYDAPAGEVAGSRAAPSAENAAVLRRLTEIQDRLRRARRSRKIAVMRREVDAAFGELASAPAANGVEVRAVDADGVAAEWVLAPGADPARRLLYLHGGAFVAGSARSHRALTMGLGARAGLAVLAIDYRLLPEHGRLDCIADCQRAYRWLLEHGPQGAAPPRDVYVAGDSAGGNLALVLIAWIRDAGLRQVDAAVAFAPSTDSTMASPSLRTHIASDPFLGPTVGRLVRLPRWTLAYLTMLGARRPPQDPALSPAHGNLAGLPPTLVQVSTSEMLLDDARRYVNRARSHGSPAALELWPDMIHVFQLFESISPEGREALDHAAAFLDRHRAS